MQYISRVNGEEIRVDKVIRIMTPKAEEWIQKFDEHTVDMCHKFGIIYQKEGQVCVRVRACVVLTSSFVTYRPASVTIEWDISHEKSGSSPDQSETSK